MKYRDSVKLSKIREEAREKLMFVHVTKTHIITEPHVSNKLFEDEWYWNYQPNGIFMQLKGREDCGRAGILIHYDPSPGVAKVQNNF